MTSFPPPSHGSGSSAPTTRAAEPWTGGNGALASRSSRQMTTAARAFLASLDASQREQVVYPDLGDVARTWWNNLPSIASPRAGLSLGDLGEAQRTLLHDLLCASTSSQGYHKLTGAIWSDEILRDPRDRDRVFGAVYYFVSVFGSPEDANWAWMLTGHHMAAAFTVSDDRAGFTPMFTGAQPVQVPSGIMAGWHVLPRDAARAAELLATLSAEQRCVAVLGGTAPDDIFEGPGRRASLGAFQGIPSGQLDDAQQRLLWALVQEFVCNADFDAAEAQLALIQQTWNETHFAWLGPPPDPAARYYFRVHGPRILIEYDVQEPLVSGGGHVHAVTRDPANDYGVDWLGLHYQESPRRRGDA